ncbi:hypothetical protein F504_253 [Ralstonia pseudosolanacearum FQY_4]|nr:hypothetical protein F504_253 [Ralstonia pseudosolanacearum FQY_4]
MQGPRQCGNQEPARPAPVARRHATRHADFPQGRRGVLLEWAAPPCRPAERARRVQRCSASVAKCIVCTNRENTQPRPALFLPMADGTSNACAR